jgi:hypothetical protein
MRSRHLGRTLPFFIPFVCLVCAIILTGISPVFAEEATPLDERVFRMEQELNELRQQNQQLREEMLLLRQQLQEEQVEPIPTVPTPVLPPVPPVAKVEVAPQFDVGYKNGFFIASDDGAFSLLLGGRVTSRYTGFASDTPLVDQFSVKRARLESEATLLDYYSLRLQVEFADASKPTDNYSTKLKDGYIDIHYIPE